VLWIDSAASGSWPEDLLPRSLLGHPALLALAQAAGSAGHGRRESPRFCRCWWQRDRGPRSGRSRRSTEARRPGQGWTRRGCLGADDGRQVTRALQSREDGSTRRLQVLGWSCERIEVAPHHRVFRSLSHALPGRSSARRGSPRLLVL